MVAHKPINVIQDCKEMALNFDRREKLLWALQCLRAPGSRSLGRVVKVLIEHFTSYSHCRWCQKTVTRLKHVDSAVYWHNFGH